MCTQCECFLFQFFWKLLFDLNWWKIGFQLNTGNLPINRVCLQFETIGGKITRCGDVISSMKVMLTMMLFISIGEMKNDLNIDYKRYERKRVFAFIYLLSSDNYKFLCQFQSESVPPCATAVFIGQLGS